MRVVGTAHPTEARWRLGLLGLAEEEEEEAADEGGEDGEWNSIGVGEGGFGGLGIVEVLLDLFVSGLAVCGDRSGIGQWRGHRRFLGWTDEGDGFVACRRRVLGLGCEVGSGQDEEECGEHGFSSSGEEGLSFKGRSCGGYRTVSTEALVVGPIMNGGTVAPFATILPKLVGYQSQTD